MKMIAIACIALLVGCVTDRHIQRHAGYVLDKELEMRMLDLIESEQFTQAEQVRLKEHYTEEGFRLQMAGLLSALYQNQGWLIGSGGVLVGAGGLIGSRKKVKNASQQNKRG